MEQAEKSLFSRSCVSIIFGFLWKLRWEKDMVNIVLKIFCENGHHGFDGAAKAHSIQYK